MPIFRSLYRLLIWGRLTYHDDSVNISFIINTAMGGYGVPITALLPDESV